MTDPSTHPASRPEVWRAVDEGWGRRATDFATLSEPANCREYVALHQELEVAVGDRVLDVACGAGLAVELAAARGATSAGVDASARLVAVAADRSPGADVRVGDMHALPWADGSFDVVTSFRGIWGTTPDALAEVRRVLVPGGRVGITVWGHIKASPGAWALSPFTLAAPPKVANQAAMVALGRPGAGEELLARFGFEDVRRVSIPFAWEFADPVAYARALASTGPAYESIQAVGEAAFLAAAVEVAEARMRDGLPLRAEIDVVGYVARRPLADPTAAAGAVTEAGPVADRAGSPRPATVGFVAGPEPGDAVRALYAEDLEDLGYVMNASRLWGHQPAAMDALFDLLGQVARAAGLSFRERAVLVLAGAATLGDAYCSLAWGSKLAGVADAELPASILRGDDVGLDDRERALAGWARAVVRDPNATEPGDLAPLRVAGFDDGQIVAITTFVGLRLAFSTVNDALGAAPDHALGEATAGPLRAAVTYGRPVEPAGPGGAGAAAGSPQPV